MFEYTNRLLDYGVELGIPAANVIINHKGKEVYNAYRGAFDENGAPLTENTLFNIYSCSKFITCFSAMKLFEEGKFSLEDDVAEYIGAFGDMKVIKNGSVVSAENRIKIKHLFTMTSGLGYDTKSEYIKEGVKETDGECPTVEMMKYIAKAPLSFEPGERWQYSFSHDVIAALVEVISGKRFGEYVDELIFKPLCMNNSTFMLPDNRLSELCEQYSYDEKTKEYVNIGKKILNYKLGSRYESGGAGCISTTKDYMKFLEAVRTHKILSGDTIRLMSSPAITEEQDASFWGPRGYTYGLGIRVPDSTAKRTDYGWGGAAGAFAAVDEENEITVYYSQHVIASPIRTIRKDFIEAAKLDLGFDAFSEDMWSGEGSHLA